MADSRPGEPEGRMILVFQMAKVASRSWFTLLERAFPDRAVHHFHSMSSGSVDRAEDVASRPDASQTIRYLSLPRLGRPPEDLARHIRDGVWIGPPVDIVCGMRDPVARAISAVGFLSNRLGYTRRPVTIRDGGTPDALRDLFLHVLEAARTGARPRDTLVELLVHAVADYRRWFAEELGAGFGLDIAGKPFDRQASALTIDRAHHRLLVYRVEDLGHPDRAARLLQTASAHLGRTLPAIPASDEAGESRFQHFYRAYRDMITLDEATLDWFYDTDIVRQFYDPLEVAAFRRRWSQPRDMAR